MLTIGNIMFPDEAIGTSTIADIQRKADDQFQQFSDIKTTAGYLISELAPKSLLGIGCGRGLLELLLCKRYDIKQVCLIDGDGSPTIREYAFHADMQPWDDVRKAKFLFSVNTPYVEVLASHPGDNLPDEIDLITSFKSWGHHYPVSIYLNSVLERLTPKGLIILDLRIGRGGEDDLETAGLKLITIIPHHSIKCRRMVWKRR